MGRNKKSGKLKAVILAFLVIAVFSAVYVYSRYPLKHFGIIRANAERYGLDPALVCAVIHTESKFRDDALSPKGASGLMQITEPTAGWIAGRLGLAGYDYARIFDPELNIELGCYYARWLLDRYNGDEDLALAAYNAGIGNVDKWLRNPDYSSGGKSLDYIPFKETRDFVRRVADARRVYGVMLKLAGRYL